MIKFKPKIANLEEFVEAKVNLTLRTPIKKSSEDVPNEIKKFIDIDNIEIQISSNLMRSGGIHEILQKQEDEFVKAILTPNAKIKTVLETWYHLKEIVSLLKNDSDGLENSYLEKLIKDETFFSSEMDRLFQESDTHDALFKFETLMNVPLNKQKTLESFVDAFDSQINWNSDTLQFVNIKFYYEPKKKIENPLDLLDVSHVSKDDHKDQEDDEDNEDNLELSEEFKLKFKEVELRYKVMIDYFKKSGKQELIDPNWSNPAWLADKAKEELNDKK